MGINVDSTISFTFAIGSALAGAAGVLVGIYYNSINPLMGALPGLKAFVAAVFGGIGIIPGAMIGGYFIGIVEVFVSGYLDSMYKDAVVFAILILILIIKPAVAQQKHRGRLAMRKLIKNRNVRIALFCLLSLQWYRYSIL